MSLGHQVVRSPIDGLLDVCAEIEDADLASDSEVSPAAARPSAVPDLPHLAAAVKGLDIHGEILPHSLFVAYQTILRQLIEVEAGL